MLNEIVITGRLTADPVLKQTPNNVAVCAFDIACERDIKNGNGEKETDFVHIVAWRNTAEFISKYFAKGALINITGRLQMRKWKTESGENRTTAEIVVRNAYFAESKQQPPANNERPVFQEVTVDDGQLPF